MSWKILMSSDECNEHWNDLLLRCRLTKDGKCIEEQCPFLYNAEPSTDPYDE